MKQKNKCKCHCHLNPINKTLGKVRYCSKCVNCHIPPKQDTEDNWVDRFRKRYRELWNKEHFHPETVNYWDGIEPELEQFIKAELDRAYKTGQEDEAIECNIDFEEEFALYKKELRKKIGKMKKWYKTHLSTEMDKGYIDALDDLLEELK